MSDERDEVTAGGALDQLPDPDPDETRDWLDSLRDVVDREGRGGPASCSARSWTGPASSRWGCRPALQRLRQHHPGRGRADYPGDEELERRLLAIVRWNAAAIVSRANRPELGVGEHMASYASAAELFESASTTSSRARRAGRATRSTSRGHSAPACTPGRSWRGG